ncbi:uncharacterized protein LOC143253826 [Tachypleus tridentatus]|uniref:uncharacterized protein LOC143253826 n=1 Tax=Tachypleus tridentatus TaxID=6853 RepID=UPI003FD0417E
MLQFGTEHSSPEGSARSATRRKPYDFFSSIFRKKTKDPEAKLTDTSEETSEYIGTQPNITPDSTDLLPIWEEGQKKQPSTLIAFHQPHAFLQQENTPADDMVALELSRQDNPILQKRLLTHEDNEMVSDDTFIPLSESDQEILVQNKDKRKDDALSADDFHSLLIRSPPPKFDNAVVQFKFPETNQLEINLSSLSVSTGKIRKSRELVPLVKEGNIFCYLSPLESLEKKEAKPLKPIMSKSGVGVLDSGFKEILESQKQKLYLTRPIPTASMDRNRQSPVTPQPNLSLFSQPLQKTKESSIGETRPVSDYSNFRPLSTIGTLTPLNGETVRSLKPLKRFRSKTENIISSTSAQDLLLTPPVVSVSDSEELESSHRRRSMLLTVAKHDEDEKQRKKNFINSFESR